MEGGGGKLCVSRQHRSGVALFCSAEHGCHSRVRVETSSAAQTVRLPAPRSRPDRKEAPVLTRRASDLTSQANTCSPEEAPRFRMLLKSARFGMGLWI